MKTSPCDENGEWYDEEMVRVAAGRLVDKRQRAKDARRVVDRDMAAEGREIAAKWAKKRGFDNIEAYVLAERIDWSEALKRVMISLLEANRPPREPNAKWSGTAADLGVTAREFSPTPERMAAGRRELGIDPPEEVA